MAKKLKITGDIIHEAYEVSQKVFEDKITKSKGIEILSENNRMNKGSATFYITIFDHMMKGENYTRTMNVASMEHFLSNIYNDYGKETLSRALLALHKHIGYYDAGHTGKLRKMRELYDKYSLVTNRNEKEQEEIITYYKNTPSRSEIINQLKNLKETDPELVTINHKAYKRDNRTIAQIKFIRNFKCQICETTILKKDGTYYIEAAHILPKNKKGREAPENIILLCPNHHKEFDLGDRIIKNQTKTQVEFLLNKKLYNLSLSIE